MVSYAFKCHSNLLNKREFVLSKAELQFFLTARPASQTHDSHKGRMILNHESPAGRIKNCGEKSAFSICNFRFECFLNNIGKNQYRKTPQQYRDHYFP